MGETKETYCWQCGQQRRINTCGVCEDCWEKFAFLRDGCKGKEGREKED